MPDKLIRTIKAVSVKNKDNGSIGFLTNEEENHWYNVNGDAKDLDVLLANIIQKGNSVEFEVENGVPKNFVVKEKAEQQGSFTDDLTSFEDLLNNAHEKFEDCMSISTELIENDWEKQRAIFKAKVEIFANDEQAEKYQIGELSTETKNPVRLKLAEFTAYGDATQDNCGEMVKKHYIRMAETRAIARALRWATNNAKAAEEETENGELTDEDQEEMAKP